MQVFAHAIDEGLGRENTHAIGIRAQFLNKLKRWSNAVLEDAVFVLTLNLLLACVQGKRADEVGCLMVGTDADSLWWNIAVNTIIRVEHFMYVESVW